MLPIARWPRAAATIARTFGAAGLVLRATHELRRRAGWFRAVPRMPGVPGAGQPLFTIDAQALRAADRSGAGRSRAERAVAGEYQAFRVQWRPLPSGAEGWLTHPVTGRRFPDAPWWRVPHLSPDLGDIKEVWEPARLGWAYDLVRGWLLTGDERFAEAFFVQFESWRASSPPFMGPHWACGQETAIRAIALLYAESGLNGAGAATPDRMAELRAVLGWSGERISDAIGYALSQRNNHGISEAVGLLALGERLRGTHPGADGWRRRGTRLLPRLIREQFGEDGWYIQHSFTYLRLALDQCVVAARALGTRGESLPRASLERLRAAGALLAQVMDPPTGVVPNHGANDGAFVHPITSAAYRDFRPVATAISALFGAPLPEGAAPDPETLAWLSAPLPAAAGPGVVMASGASGWAAARNGPFQLFFRAGRYRSRPGHLDPLVLDLRYRGREVLVDPGTYAYNAPPPWRNGLIGAAVHNGPLINGGEPGIRGPRFLWYAWPQAELTGHRQDGATLVLEGEIPGRVRRRIEADATAVTVTDTALAVDARELSVCWLLHPDASPGWLHVTGGAEVVEAAEGAVTGWFSPGYGERLPSRAIIVRRRVRPGDEVVTRIAPPKDLSPPVAVD